MTPTPPPPKLVGKPRRPDSELTARQAEILAWVLLYRRVASTWPSYREILIALDFASTNSVCLHLRRISRSGLLAYRGTRDFTANLELIRASGVLDRVPWVKLVGRENLLYSPPPLMVDTLSGIPGFQGILRK